MRDASRNPEFVELLTLHQSRVFAYIFALLRDLNDAEDVFQQTSLVLWSKFDDFQQDSDFIRWAFSIAQFEVSNFLRTKRRRQARFSAEFQEHLADLQARQDVELLELRRQALTQCLDKLGSEDRDLIERCYGARMTMKEVAEQLGCRPHIVYDGVSRIRRMLLRCIERTLAGE